MTHFNGRSIWLSIGLTLCTIVLGVTATQAAPLKFQPILSETDAATCGVILPTKARAHLRFFQRQGKTWLTVRMYHGVPNTLHTVWLKLDGPSPLTGTGVTALSNPDRLPALIHATPMAALEKGPAAGKGDNGEGSNDLSVISNGFVTNGRGHGHLQARLNFPLLRGAYQFQEFDSDLARVPIGDTPFTLRIASHCTDQAGHGLVPGQHERWFDWQ